MSGSSARLRGDQRGQGYTPPATAFDRPRCPARSSARTSSASRSCRSGCRRPSSSRSWRRSSTPSRSTRSSPTPSPSAMKDWAMEKGATHYAHVFYPLTGLTAEKHDSFLEPGGDGSSIAEFAGKTLTQGEPDASSFPNGGLRYTFEARGYTGWDVTSPAYVLENPNGNTLCIPTVFVSMTGDALDHKTPLLRSQQAMAVHAERVLKLFGHENPDAVVSFAGAEQEYFLIDRQLLPRPPRPAQLRPHAVRRQAAEGPGVRRPLLRRHPRPGARLHARHRARAVQARHPGQDPAQRGRARPVRDRADVRAGQRRRRPPAAADDHAQEQSPRSTAWSACSTRSRSRASTARASTSTSRSATRTEGNLLLPGDTPHDNAQFLVFCAAVIRSVHKYGGLLRASVASATNDHRLGANEAPPAIISIFLGDQLTDVFDQIAKGGATSSKEKGTLLIGVDTLPGAADRPGRPQPHQPVRLHRQPVRVPRPRLAAVRSPARWSRSTRSWPRRCDYIADRARGRSSPTAPSSTPRCRRCSRRSSPSTAASSSTATATPRTGRSRRPPAACRTCAPRWTRCRS